MTDRIRDKGFFSKLRETYFKYLPGQTRYAKPKIGVTADFPTSLGLVLSKVSQKIARLLRYPMSFVCFLQGWQDRRTHQNRAKWAEQFLKQNNVLDVLSSGDPEEYPPTYTDLANLYQLIRLRKPTVIVELGTGFSTIVIAAALRDNLDEQIETPGHLYSVDCNQRWIDNTKAKISSELEDFVTFTVSSASVCEHFGTLCHRYDQLPNVSPNFIYVDGPANRDVTGEIAGVGFTEGRSVVGADVLLYESTAPLDFFILVDGRWETCRFLKRSLQGRYRHRRYVARKYETFEYISEEFY